KAPTTAIPLLPIQRDNLFKLDVDNMIWQDVGLEDELLEAPMWLADDQVHRGICFMLKLHRCEEEERRLMGEHCILQEWFMDEWLAMEWSLVDAGERLYYYLHGCRTYLTQLFLDREVKVCHMPQAWEMPVCWGHTPADLASGLCFHHHASTAHVLQYEDLGMSEEDVDDMYSDDSLGENYERWMGIGEELGLEVNEASDEGEDMDGFDLGYLVSSPLGPHSSTRV
ncbi:hypothetical protein PAXRUDRAFT_168284, partial [Paxillus rubicundulus Ve08.2h10]